MQQNSEGKNTDGEKEKVWKKYQHLIVPGFLILALAISFFFILFRFDYLCGRVSHLQTILQPFILGGVMGYILQIGIAHV